MRSCPGSILIALILAGAVGAAVPPVHSQGITAGTRVRVTTADGRTVGNVQSSSPDSLALDVRDVGSSAYGWNEISRLEVSTGTRGRAGRGALIGAGAATALTVGTILFGSSEDELEDDLSDMILIISLPVNAALGAGVGALAGLAWRTERWSVLPISGVSSQNGISPGLRFAMRL